MSTMASTCEAPTNLVATSADKQQNKAAKAEKQQKSAPSLAKKKLSEEDRLSSESSSVHSSSNVDSAEECEETFEDASENLSTKSSAQSDSGHSSSRLSPDDVSSTTESEQEDEEEVEPNLEESLRDITRLLSMALDNRFHEAYRGTEKWAHRSLYHALGKGTLSFLKGCLTLERPEIQRAIEDLRNCMDVCQREKRQSMTRMVWRPNYNTYNDVEVHAELVYAEAMLMTALLTFLEDQNLLNLVRGAFRIRTCYQSYKECFYILNNRTEWCSDFSRLHFESGVRMGIGTFNLMLSHMPGKVLKLLEFVGFSGNRDQGLQELETSTFLTDGLRCPLATLIMLVYQCYIEHIFGLGDGDMKCVSQLLDFALAKHPDGAFFLLFLGRQKQLTGQIEEAIEAFERCIAAQNEWKQFHNICYWELLWCYAVQCEWEKAAHYANILRQQCKWSPAAYTYQYATFTYMIMAEKNRPELRPEVDKYLKLVPETRIRFAGKTIPAEKFAIIQSDKYFERGGTMTLPAIEFMYIWNIFAVIGQSPHLLNPILERIDRHLRVEEENLDNPAHYRDVYCRLLLLKGMCLRYLQRSEESNECFLKVIGNKHALVKPNTYLIPHATMELGLNYMRAGAFTEARQWLDECKSYSSYALETIVHFRIHTAIRTMNLISKAEKKKRMQQQQQLDSITEDAAETEEGDEVAKKGGGGSGFGSIWSALSRRWNGNGVAGEKVIATEEVITEEVEFEVEQTAASSAASQLKSHSQQSQPSSS